MGEAVRGLRRNQRVGRGGGAPRGGMQKPPMRRAGERVMPERQVQGRQVKQGKRGKQGKEPKKAKAKQSQPVRNSAQ
jgi:hypothetical protein